MGFFWGQPSHKRVVWLGAGAGLVLLGLAAENATIGKGQRSLVLAVLFVGLAEFGWAAELLPRHQGTLAGWARLARWICAIAGTAFAIPSLQGGYLPLAAGAPLGGVVLVLVMAPDGWGDPGQRPGHRRSRGPTP